MHPIVEYVTLSVRDKLLSVRMLEHPILRPKDIKEANTL